MAQLITDATVSLKIEGVISELHPELDKNQIQEVAHFVFHRMNMNPLREQAEKLIEEYISDELGLNM
tara:strand:- start:331 stop:531 length:201 start_codon:yes stop_codon:yes gene_type:complete